MPLPELETLLRPAGYYRQKARSLKTFVEFVDNSYGGSLSRMFAEPTVKLRHELLALKGVGPETADAILLYAGQHEVFVVDAYARRILQRHGIAPEDSDYESVRALFERSFSARGSSDRSAWEGGNQDRAGAFVSSPHRPTPMSVMPRSAVAQRYGEMHGLVVSVGKHYCLKSKPKCEACPLRGFLP